MLVVRYMHIAERWLRSASSFLYNLQFTFESIHPSRNVTTKFYQSFFSCCISRCNPNVFLLSTVSDENKKEKKLGLKIYRSIEKCIYIYRIKIYARISLYSQKMHYNARSLLHKSVQVDRRRGDSKLSYRLRPRRGLCRDRVSIRVKVSLCAHFLTHHDF